MAGAGVTLVHRLVAAVLLSVVVVVMMTEALVSSAALAMEAAPCEDMVATL